jgi:hypothetical protein
MRELLAKELRMPRQATQQLAPMASETPRNTGLSYKMAVMFSGKVAVGFPGLLSGSERYFGGKF